MKKIRKWVITGGHHNSALVVGNILLDQGDQVVWFGHRHASSGDTHDSAEYLEVTGSQIPFFDLKAGKLGQTSSLSQFFEIPLGIIHAIKLLKVQSPDAVISFGGYLGFATAIAAYLLGIPVFLHEQTVIAGKANKLTAKLATSVYLTWSSSLVYFKGNKNIKVVGLPLRPSIIKESRKKLFPAGKPTILILGGKLGSHIINQKIFTHLPELLSRYNLIHQTGTSTATGDYEKSLILKSNLSPDLAACYIPVGYIGESEIGIMLDGADVVVGRSGAHTTYELGIKGKRAVLIPYLLTHDQEQRKNANLLVSQGLAEIIPESELSFPRLRTAISKVLRMKKVTPLPLPKDAGEQMILDMHKMLEE